MNTTARDHVQAPSRARFSVRQLATAAVLVGSLTACSLGGTTEEAGDPKQESRGSETPQDATVVLATHESWAVPDEVLAAFTEETGYRVDVQAAGDAGALTNKLVLTRESPIADVVFGVDNTFASRAVAEGVFEDHEPAEAPASVEDFELPDAEGAAALTPVDFGDVCVNIDDVWFQEQGIDPPETLADLTDPAYEGLFVTPGAATSSPGMAFLLATVAEFGEDGWEAYWEELMANGTRVTASWTDAYTVDFTAGGGGDRPIVLSYASSPPFTIPDGGEEPTTSALLDTCYRQVEYAGVLAGAANPEGARALVDFLVGPQFQAALPENMYVFPADTSVQLPELWSRWAKTPDQALNVDPDMVDENRDAWLTAWGEITTR